jgi:hypothetical protein
MDTSEGVIGSSFRRAQCLDSGGPVWRASDGASIGLITGGRKNLTETLVEPLLHPRRMPAFVAPGILNHSEMGNISLKLGDE